jgi:ankyrin repeat protein
LCRQALADGADIEGRSSFGKTALYLAAEGLHLETTRVLIEHGADLHATNQSGRIALHRAVISIDEDTGLEYTQLLLGAGARLDFVPDGASNDYCTPFQFALQFGQSGIVSYLLEQYGRLAEEKTLAGKSSLEIASPENRELLLAIQTTQTVCDVVGESYEQRQRSSMSTSFGAL